MGYGYHWAGGAPGPIAPIESGETRASRSLTWTLDDYDTYGLIENRSKFILGLPLYGRQWPTESSEVPGIERSSGVAVSMSQCDISLRLTSAGTRTLPRHTRSSNEVKAGSSSSVRTSILLKQSMDLLKVEISVA